MTHYTEEINEKKGMNLIVIIFYSFTSAIHIYRLSTQFLSVTRAIFYSFLPLYFYRNKSHWWGLQSESKRLRKKWNPEFTLFLDSKAKVKKIIYLLILLIMIDLILAFVNVGLVYIFYRLYNTICFLLSS